MVHRSPLSPRTFKRFGVVAANAPSEIRLGKWAMLGSVRLGKWAMLGSLAVSPPGGKGGKGPN